MIKITYPGTGNYSTFSYDGKGRAVVVLEYLGGSLSSTKQFVWTANDRCETRNATGGLLNQFFGFGQTISSTNYFYDVDNFGSIREMNNSSGAIQAQYGYDLYGRVTKLQGSLSSDLQFTGYYTHALSGLNLSRTRAYDASLGRFISRDPIGEDDDVNLYDYLKNSPTDGIDPLGLFHIPGTNFCGAGYSSGSSEPDYAEDSPNYPLPGDPRRTGPHSGILGPLDSCCMAHDDCMNRAHHMSDPKCAQHARSTCDRKLAACAAKSGVLPFTIVFGIKSFFRGPGTYIGP